MATVMGKTREITADYDCFEDTVESLKLLLCILREGENDRSTL